MHILLTNIQFGYLTNIIKYTRLTKIYLQIFAIVVVFLQIVLCLLLAIHIHIDMSHLKHIQLEYCPRVLYTPLSLLYTSICRQHIFKFYEVNNRTIIIIRI